MNQKCKHCNYVWQPRTSEPKSCPRCKRRTDYPKLEAKNENKYKGKSNN